MILPFGLPHSKRGPFPRISMTLTALLLAGGAHAQGFTSAPISTATPAFNRSVSLKVDPSNGTSYCAYTTTPIDGEVFYGTRPAGGTWTLLDVNGAAREVSLTTDKTFESVSAHLALSEFNTQNPETISHLTWAYYDGAWSYEVVEPATYLDTKDVWFPSIALGPNHQPLIAYFYDDQGGTSELRLAIRAQGGGWSHTVVPFAGPTDITLQMIGATPVVSFMAFNGSVRYAYPTVEGWVQEVVEDYPSSPHTAVMTVPPNGIPQVAYVTSSDGMLTVAKRLGPDNWVKTKVGLAMANRLSIAHDESNLVHVAYANSDSVGYAGQTSECGWGYQGVATSFQPSEVSIGIQNTSPRKARIAYAGTDAEGSLYYLAEGDQADISPPATTSSLYISDFTMSPRTVTLSWAAPGDDGTCGQASSYDFRKRSGSPITETNWPGCAPLTGEPAPAPAGTVQNFTFPGPSGSLFWYYAMKTTDEAGNTSALSNNDCIRFNPPGLCEGGGSAAAESREEFGAARALAISSVRPNPVAGGGAFVSLTLADDSPATLEVLDIAGRIVEAHTIADVGPGMHEMRIGSEVRLSPGHYRIRLRQGGRFSTRSAIVIH